MNELFAQIIAEEKAKIVRLVPTPEPPFGYGTEISCTTAISETLEELDPESPRAIAEWVFRVWTIPRAAMPDQEDPEEANLGRDIQAILNRGMTPAEIRAEAAQLQAEAEKDDRIDTCSVTIEQRDARGSSWRISALIRPENPDLATFSLIVAVTDGKALLEAFTA